MAEGSLTERVRILEQKVELLEKLPEEMRLLTGTVVDLSAKVEGLSTSFLQLRTEMRDGFSAFREEMRREFSAFRTEMRGLHENTMAQRRTLFEEVIARIALLDEHRHGKPKRTRRS